MAISLDILRWAAAHGINPIWINNICCMIAGGSIVYLWYLSRGRK